MDKLFAVVDATFKDNLGQLTLHRMPGALPYAGKFRLIDFTLSNLSNSGVTNVAIFPYGNYRSLQDHVGSGKRWDLDRRKDGLFILPPKNQYILPGNMITFQRMYEHIEFFKRSTQEYCIITTANIVWNIDFNDVLEFHLEKQADITEIVYENIRLKSFVLSKQLLMEYIEEYDSLEYRSMLELVTKSPSLVIKRYHHRSYTRTITDPFNYLKSNLDVLKFDIGKHIFQEERPIYSKEKTAPPATYLSNAKVENAMISSGCMIDGTIINSVIGRNVFVKKGAIIKNSYIMSNCVIEESAHLEYAILDKQTVVMKDTLALGTLRRPYVTQKEQIITNFEELRVLIVASESYPFIKTGGLADVIGSLSRNLARSNVDVTVILPYYKKIKDSFTESIKSEFTKTIIFAGERYKIRVYKYIYKKVKYYFIDNFDFFDTDNVYGYENDTERFAFFNKAIVDILEDFDKFDLIHIHDWHTSLIPILLDNSIHRGMKTLLTIHNIDYQGVAENNIIKKIGIENFIYRDEHVNFLEIGINTATRLSTVSPTYKEELKYEYYGRNLTYSLMKRERDFYGILNGISSSWNPANDKLIYETYQIDTIEKKASNKTFLQAQMKLPVGEGYFVIGMVTRIVEQKGFDLLIQSLHKVLQNEKIQFVLLGSGNQQYINELQQLQLQFPSQIALNIGYDSTVPNYIYAGSDVFLMPSRFEPCGLGQMIALKYGTIPIVRETGGLSDTVLKYDPYTKKGNGFTFTNYDTHDLEQAINHAYSVFKNEKDIWQKLIHRGMNDDNSIKKSTNQYIELYRLIVKN